METTCERFPHIVTLIFKNLDNQSLARSKNASSKIRKSLRQEKFYWIQIIRKYIRRFKGSKKSWNQVVHKTSFNMIKQLAVAAQQFFKNYSFKRIAPLHIAAQSGNFALCQHIIAKANIKNPKGGFKIKFDYMNRAIVDKSNCTMVEKTTTPLHLAAMNGKVETCRLILDNVENGNPRNAKGETPLQFAMANHHLEVCKLIIEKVEDKNPADLFGGYTPLHYAAEMGHLYICKLIIQNVVNKHPVTWHGETPKDLSDQQKGNPKEISELFE